MDFLTSLVEELNNNIGIQILGAILICGVIAGFLNGMIRDLFKK